MTCIYNTTCEKCDKPYMSGLEFIYDNSGRLLCISCYNELYPDDEADYNKKVKNYYLGVFEKDGNYTIILNEGENFETLIKMKKSVAIELRDKLNEILSNEKED